VDHGIFVLVVHGIFVLVLKDTNAKRESYWCRVLKDCVPSLPHKTRKAKTENQSFYRDNLCLPDGDRHQTK
jgi:hypothetical protein